MTRQTRRQKQESSSSSSSEESEEVKPAVQEMKFRNRRGANIKKMINHEEDAFWNDNKYFQQDLDDEESFKAEDQKLEGDSYDSDFGKDDEKEGGEDEENSGPSEKDSKGVSKPKVKRINKKLQNHKTLDQIIQEDEGRKFYIHEFMTQEELLREAAETEVKNMESLHNLIMIEEERRRIHLRQKTKIEGPYIRHIVRALGPQEQSDYSDRPFSRIKSIYRFLNHKGVDIDLFIKRTPRTKQFKYRDPQTRQEYNTPQEFQKIRKLAISKVKLKQKAKVQNLEQLINQFSN